jgi:hypothetical protein
MRTGRPTAIADADELRAASAEFVARFTERPDGFIRAADPRVLLDAVDDLL